MNILKVFGILVIFSITISAQNLDLPNHKLKGYNVRTLEDLENLAEEEIDVSVGALILCKFYDSTVDIDDCLKKLDKISAPLYEKVSKEKITDPKIIMDLIKNRIFKELEFKYVLELSAEKFLLSEILKKEKKAEGHCLGFTTLLVSIGQRMGVKLSPVECYRHIYVEYSKNNKTIRMETGDFGNHFKEEWLSEKPNNIQGKKSGLYFKPLTNRELLSVYAGNLSAYFASKGKFDEATKFSHVATTFLLKRHRDYTSMINLASIYFMERKIYTSEYLFKRAFNLNSGDPLVANRLCLIYLSWNKVDDALDVLLKSYVHNENDPVILNNLAVCYYHKGKFEKSVEYSSKALSVNRKFLNAFLNYGYGCLELKRYDDVEYAAERAMELEENYIGGYVLMVDLLYRQKEYPKAKEWLEKIQNVAVQVTVKVNLYRLANDVEQYNRFMQIHLENQKYIQKLNLMTLLIDDAIKKEEEEKKKEEERKKALEKKKKAERKKALEKKKKAERKKALEKKRKVERRKALERKKTSEPENAKEDKKEVKEEEIKNGDSQGELNEDSESENN